MTSVAINLFACIQERCAALVLQVSGFVAYIRFVAGQIAGIELELRLLLFGFHPNRHRAMKHHDTYRFAKSPAMFRGVTTPATATD